MKKLIFSAFFFIINFANAQNYGVESTIISKIDKDELKKYNVENDKFRDLTFITPKVSMTSKYSYLSLKEGILNIRLVMEYNGTNWIYLKKVIIKFNDKKIEYPAGEIKTYVGNGYLTETSDVKCSPEIIRSLQEIVQTDKVFVRLEGDGKVDDFEMSNKTKKSIKLALELYEKLKK